MGPPGVFRRSGRTALLARLVGPRASALDPEHGNAGVSHGDHVYEYLSVRCCEGGRQEDRDGRGILCENPLCPMHVCRRADEPSRLLGLRTERVRVPSLGIYEQDRASRFESCTASGRHASIPQTGMPVPRGRRSSGPASQSLYPPWTSMERGRLAAAFGRCSSSTPFRMAAETPFPSTSSEIRNSRW